MLESALFKKVMICLHDFFLQLLYIFLKRTLFTDEQVALKKKEKEAPKKWNNTWEKSESDKIVWEKLQIFDQSKVRVSKSSIYGL